MDPTSVNYAHFGYQLNYSTTCIFCHDPDGKNHLINLHRNEQPELSTNFPHSTTICSSAQGMLLYVHHHPTNAFYNNLPFTTYSLGNPFYDNPPFTSTLSHIPQPPRRHPWDTTHVALTTQFNPTAAYHVICILPVQTPTEGTYYTIDIYSSDHQNDWFSAVNERCRSDPHRYIVPNSGISCGRWAYWLSWGGNMSTRDTYVVRIDPMNRLNPRRYQLMTYLAMPNGILGCDDVKMNLGRWGDDVGLVVANATRRRIELYIMNNMYNTYLDLDCPKMTGWMECLLFLNVVLNPEMEESAVTINGNEIMCKKMPQPLRFESMKMEVLLLVGRRLLRWENSRIDYATSRVVEVDMEGIELTAEVAPRIGICGIPHVITSSLPSHFEYNNQ